MTLSIVNTKQHSVNFYDGHKPTAVNEEDFKVNFIKYGIRLKLTKQMVYYY